ncbi:hypothetical protein C8Q74DRAFT_1304444 [Fomes fomentarius]|nr:hypothetical protein C8Q74DRAFT_1304444 [Fomes fomentarius]
MLSTTPYRTTFVHLQVSEARTDQRLLKRQLRCHIGVRVKCRHDVRDAGQGGGIHKSTTISQRPIQVRSCSFPPPRHTLVRAIDHRSISMSVQKCCIGDKAQLTLEIDPQRG